MSSTRATSCRHSNSNWMPNSPYSLVAKEGGLAGQLYTASQMLHEAGTIPAPLSRSSITNSIDASYMSAFVAEQRGAK